VAKLVIKAGRNAGAEFKLNADRLVMGRRSACPIPVADAKASREHACINMRNGSIFVQDLSRNGTLLNGKPAEKAEPGSPMKFGDQIRIGDTVMELIDQSAEPIEIEIPGYQIIEKVGLGGMGVVYKARQLSMDRIVALKVLNERYSSNAEFQDRFIREARAAGRLNHPNVIHVHDISRANGRHYFSMEYIDGSSIKEVLKIERKMDVNKSLDIVLQAAKALEFAHENRIVHRDIKPDNIMLTRESIVKIADLGIAKTFEEAAPSAKEHRRIMGTPHYMAPEQALGKAIDHRVDIYSLGATFYHMITGSTPFTGSTAHEVLKAHIQESLPPIQDMNPDVPDPVCFIIERMMAKLPEKRYPDMSKVIEDIERVQRGVVAGINRIEAGDSTIMRAIRAKSATQKKLQRSSEELSDDAATGAHSAVSAGKMALVAALVFAIGVALVLVVFKKDQGGIVENTKTVTGATTGTGTKTAVAIDPAPRKLLDEAIAAQAAGDMKGYEDKLNALKKQYPAAVAEIAEADKRLNEIMAARTKQAKDDVDKKMAEAKALEAASLPDAIKKYTEVAQQAAINNFAELRVQAEGRIDVLQKQAKEDFERQMETDWNAASADAKAAVGKQDFETARKVFRDFIDGHAKAKQKDDAAKALEQVNTDAQEKFSDTKKRADASEIPDGLKLWELYAQEVKDQLNADGAKKEAAALEKKAEDLVKDATDKASKEAQNYRFDIAIQMADAAEKKVRATKFAEGAKAARELMAGVKDFHDKTMKAADDRVKKDGAPRADFHQDKRFLNEKWSITEIKGEMVTFKMGSGGEFPTKLAVLPAAEQYEFHKLFQPDDHGGLEKLCRLLGLETQAKEEQQLISSKPDQPKKDKN
jgi:tRNA A-37 threonylcarbamoyl transferase component Bud32